MLAFLLRNYFELRGSLAEMSTIAMTGQDVLDSSVGMNLGQTNCNI